MNLHPQNPTPPKPPSEAAQAARRLNGARSRGPITASGKLNSSRSALRHGLLADHVVLDSESQRQFCRFANKMHKLFLPQNEIEHALVETMTVCRWRQRRIWAMERANLSLEERRRLEADPALATESIPTLTGVAFRHLSDNSRCLDLMNRYETGFDRQYNRALTRLLSLRCEKHEISKRTGEVIDFKKAA
jgi:hypothetical protein